MKSKVVLDFRAELQKALKDKDYLTTNKLIANEIEKAGTYSLPQHIKEIILNEIYEISDRHEYRLRLLDDLADNSVAGINKKILGANPESGVTLKHLMPSVEDLEQGVRNPRRFLK